MFISLKFEGLFHDRFSTVYKYILEDTVFIKNIQIKWTNESNYHKSVLEYIMQCSGCPVHNIVKYLNSSSFNGDKYLFYNTTVINLFPHLKEDFDKYMVLL